MATANPNPIFPVYQAGIEQGAADYDSIMNNYRTLLSSAPSAQRLNFNSLRPQTIQSQAVQYQPSSNFNTALSTFRDMTTTGGYGESDLGSIRARAVSPIRSVYSNAQRNVDRQRTLQGGYSPNYNAATAKMAREQSALIGDASTNVEASIAQMVAEGKRAGAAGYAPLAAQESSAMNEIAMMNAQNVNRANEFNVGAANSANEFNAGMPLQIARFNSQSESDAFRNKLAATGGMQSMYGTTPALASMFGNQALQYNNQNLEAGKLKSAKDQAAFEAFLRMMQTQGRAN